MGHALLLEPWESKNTLGGKCFRGILFPERDDVIVKLWDGYKSQKDGRDQEVEIYLALRSVWGEQTARLICSANVDFCYGIILSNVEVY